ncbi:DUF4407 domain-containing protein [Rhodopseudomonas palustris]|uniref:DUF4407 domain-containing protein n=1 Tax=Rhodopseudomonas palustris TaxID=1076 RepID=A0A418UYQ2_RHOPL|nr:DUF4407 domain-containing protein [Rhodopseudomonas palustris]RJF68329.1 DUF4407 domain-containing protein [Rhodopseudomonas palustris]
MLQSALGVIAGVDRRTLSTCPASDKLWAAHLGASLCLSFIVVVGVSFHATGYMIANVWTRLLVSGVIGLTVLMFDRALCQSDWFYQGTLWNTAPIVSSTEARQTAWRFVRVGIRLLLSFGLAWVIAMFLELAIFSGTINEKIEADRVAANQPIYAKIAQYEAGLNAEVARRQAGIDAMEALHREILTEAPAPEPTLQTRTDDIEQQMKALAQREADIRADIAQIDRTIQRYIADMNAEEFGLKASPNNSGRPGAGPRYEYARKQKESFITQRAAREAEIGQLHLKRDELRAAQAKVAGEALAVRDQERVAIKAKADALQTRIDAARADLKQFEAAKAADVADFRQKALAQSYYQERKDRIDPLTRIAAYQELKNDPRDGATMTLFSWMTRLFIIFLEIVPVVAKIFFSPPSVYAAKIQAQVERARQRIENNEDLDDDKPAAPAPAPAMAAITLPAMSLDAVTMKQPAPQPEANLRTARPSSASADAAGHADSGHDDDWRDDRRDGYGARFDRRDAEDYPRREGYERRIAPRDARRGYDDRDRRAAMRHDFDRDHDGDFDYRHPDRRDYARRQDVPRYEPPRYDAPPRYESAQTRGARFAAQDYAIDDAAQLRGEPDFVPGELDVRDLIMPRRRSPRRETPHEEGTRDNLGLQTSPPAARPVAERPTDEIFSDQPAPAPLADTRVDASVQDEQTAHAAPILDLPTMPLRAPSARTTDPLDAAPLRTVALDPARAGDAPSQNASMAADQAAVSLSLVTNPTAERGRPERDQTSVCDAAPERFASGTPVSESHRPPDDARHEAIPPAAAGSPAPKYNADVEKLMSEAVELTKARKKPSRPRREAPVAAEHIADAELPLELGPVEALPRKD